MLLKKLFLASASVLMLALAYHLGASTATAQAPSNPVVGVASLEGTLYVGVVTANGDFYTAPKTSLSQFTYTANVFGGAPTLNRTQSWGSVKVQQR